MPDILEGIIALLILALAMIGASYVIGTRWSEVP